MKLTTYCQIYNSEADQDAQLQMQYTKNLWCKGNIVTTLFLDIQAAFLNMQKEKLITNMHTRNLAPEYCDYIDMILTQCQIQLKFNNHISLPFSLENGCCQGCPLSMLLYAIYNTPLIQIADLSNPNKCIISYVDNTTLLASRKNLKEMHGTQESGQMDHGLQVIHQDCLGNDDERSAQAIQCGSSTQNYLCC